MRRFIYLLATCCLSAQFFVSTQAQEVSNTEQGYAALERFLQGLQSLQADFTQTVQDSQDHVVEKSSGTLAIKRPGKFRWDYAKPNAQVIVSDGTRIWLYDAELEQLTIRNVDKTLSGTPAMLLSGNQAAGQDVLRTQFEVNHVEQRDGMTVVNLAPKNGDTDFKLVQLALKGDQLVAMSLTDKLAQTTLLQFSKFKRNASLSDATFKFTAPKGVDVIDNTHTDSRN